MTSSLDAVGVKEWPKPGDKMRFLGQNGYDHDLTAALKAMHPGNIYTVKSFRLGGWESSIVFEEVAGSWNSVMFEPALAAPVTPQAVEPIGYISAPMLEQLARGRSAKVWPMIIDDEYLDRVIIPLYAAAASPQPAPHADLVERLKPAMAIASATIADVDFLQLDEIKVSTDKLKILCLGAKEAIAALSAVPTTEGWPHAGGYAAAFYEIASLLGMRASSLPPKVVYETQMLPKLREVIAAAKEGGAA